MDSNLSFKSVMLKSLVAFSLFAQLGQSGPILLEDRQVKAPAVATPAVATPAASTAIPTVFPVINSTESTLPYMKAPPKNTGAFWSGIPFKLSQSAAKAQGLQTLEMSVPPLIFPQHPDSQYGSPKRRYFWDWFSEGYAQTLVTSGSKEVTVFLRAPSVELTGPSDPYTDGRMVRRSGKLLCSDYPS